MSEFKFPDEKDSDSQYEDNSVEVGVEGSVDVEVEVIDDTPEQDRGRRPLDKDVADPTDEEIESYTGNVQKRIKELTHARHDERRAKEALAREKAELERMAMVMHEENRKLREYVNTGTQHFAASQAKLAENEVEEAKRKLKAATEAFDTDAVIEAQDALMEAKLKLQQAKNFRPAPLQADEKDVQIAQQPEPKPSLDERTLRWQARNQWFGAQGHEDMTSFALGLHQKLVNSGVDPRSDDYFEQIDARMKSTFRDFFGEEDRPTSGGGSKRPTTVVAPATRSTGAKKVALTKTQLALANRFGLTPQQYAEQVAKLERSNG